MRFLLLGGTGQVGEEFRALRLPKDVEVVAPSRAALDLKDPSAIAQIISAEPWSAVINAAAYTDVDRAESEEPVAFAINAKAPARLLPKPVAAAFRSFTFQPITCSTGARAPLMSRRTNPRRSTPMAAASLPVNLAFGWQSTARNPALILGLQPLSQEFCSHDPAASRRARPPDHCRRPAWLPDRRARYRLGLPRHCHALRLGARSNTLWHLSFRRRRRSNLV